MLGEARDPVPQADQCLVRVEAFSLNRGDLKSLPGLAGGVPGWDAAGEVVQAAENGEDPASGTRVVTFGWSGAWAELRAVDIGELAKLPDNVDTGEASALPVAGVTALRALRACGDIDGKRVMITGASGGVGRFAVQLARIAGAQVVAVVGNPERDAGLEELGAEEVAIGVGAVQKPVFAVLEAAGAEVVEGALSLVEKDGVLVSITREGLPESTRQEEGPRIVPFGMGGDLGGDLAYLVRLLSEGRLDPQIGFRGDWEGVAEAAGALWERKINGKAVLEVS